MDRNQKQVIESFERVQAFVEAHPLPGGASYGAPKELLDGIVAQLGSHGMLQESGTRRERGEFARQQVLAGKLRVQHLQPIAQVARAVLPHAPEIDRLLRAPNSHVRPRILVTTAQSVRDLAAMHEQLLTASGCEPDFLVQLDAAIAALDGSLTGRALSKGSRVGAREGLKREIKRGRDAVLMIDAIVKRRFVDRADTLATWRVARRVQRYNGGQPRVASGAPVIGTVPPRAA